MRSDARVIIKVQGGQLSSLTTYMGEVKGPPQNHPSTTPAFPRLEENFLAMALRSLGGSRDKNLEFGVQVLEKLVLLTPHSKESAWLFIYAIEKATAFNVAPRLWATATNTECLGPLGMVRGVVPGPPLGCLLLAHLQPRVHLLGLQYQGGSLCVMKRSTEK